MDLEGEDDLFGGMEDPGDEATFKGQHILENPGIRHEGPSAFWIKTDWEGVGQRTLKAHTNDTVWDRFQRIGEEKRGRRGLHPKKGGVVGQTQRATVNTDTRPAEYIRRPRVLVASNGWFERRYRN